ncbi:aldose epimerase family protein [Muriicola marianensis]|uniref:Aldose 1-epimerase n=1 Tax=Muriicola marianensis TaxID=1324801 RepID=A0ABQ1R3T7_9FLAO|nr:aldose epimerase family protein [Muriicola marianensis]GGD57267.1 aldose 1-epimerase [Muriicola marianensis]
MKLHTVNNEYLQLTTLNYGAIIQELLVPDRNGNLTNCVVGFQDPEDYLKDESFLGACVGRFAGRISGAQLQIGESSYPIDAVGGVHLHGGKKGLGRRMWKVKEFHNGKDPFVTYEYLSPHLEEGYPGELYVQVTYQLLGNALRIYHEATTDRPTVVNLTNHSYFRLDGERSPDHLHLQIFAEERLETEKNLLPTGKLVKVMDTAYDFHSMRPLGSTRLDTPYVFDPDKDPKALAYSPVSGIRLTVESNQPALVVYTPKDLPSICFETQNYPDAPNHSSFPSCILQPGETYRNESFFRFDSLP